MSASKGAQFSLVSAILFALVAIGFSVFILFWKAPQDLAPDQRPKTLTAEQKQAAMQQLQVSAPPVNAPSAGTMKPPTPSEADPNDANAAAKLRILHSLNAN